MSGAYETLKDVPTMPLQRLLSAGFHVSFREAPPSKNDPKALTDRAEPVRCGVKRSVTACERDGA